MKKIIIITAAIIITLVTTGILSSCNTDNSQPFVYAGETGFASYKLDIGSAD